MDPKLTNALASAKDIYEHARALQGSQSRKECEKLKDKAIEKMLEAAENGETFFDISSTDRDALKLLAWELDKINISSFISRATPVQELGKKEYVIYEMQCKYVK